MENDVQSWKPISDSFFSFFSHDFVMGHGKILFLLLFCQSHQIATMADENQETQPLPESLVQAFHNAVNNGDDAGDEEVSFVIFHQVVIF